MNLDCVEGKPDGCAPREHDVSGPWMDRRALRDFLVGFDPRQAVVSPADEEDSE